MGKTIDVRVDLAAKEAVAEIDRIKKSAGEAEQSLDDVRSAGSVMADALKAAADKVDTEFQDLKTTSSSFATALGADFVQARAEAGQSVDQIVLGLREMGLSFDDIRADADQLADAVKRLDFVRANVDTLGSSARTTAGDFDRVRGSADQSKSVLANMVGNSASDMAVLGGVTGNAAMALGQFGEYATEGGISLKGLMKVAGPMAALTAGTMALGWAMKAAGHEAAEAKRETELWMKVNEQLADQKFAEAAQLLADEWSATIPILRELGFTEADLVATLNGKGTLLADLKAMQDANNAAIAASTGMNDAENQALINQNIQLGNVIENLEEGADARVNAIETEAKNKATTDALTAALRGNAEATKAVARESSEATRVTEVYEDAARNAAAAVAEAERATKDLEDAYAALTGSLTDRGAWLGVQDDIDAYKQKIGDATATNREKQQAVVALKESMIDYLASLEGIPPEKQTQVLALIDQGSFDAAENALAWLGRQRDVSFNPRTGGQAPSVPRFDDGGVMPGPRGVHQLALVAGGETVVPTHKPGAVVGGVVNQYVTNNFPPNVNPLSVAVAQRDLARRGFR